MNYNLRNLGPVGFKYAGLFSTKNSIGLFYRKQPDRVEFANWPHTLGYFALTPGQMKKFEAGKLALVPPGCCSPGTLCAKSEEAVILSTAPVRNGAELEAVFAKARAKVELSNR